MKSVFVCVLLFFTTITSAQVLIEGKIVDQKNLPIQYAEVLLLQTDSLGILSELADEMGLFRIRYQPGTYILQVRQVGQVLYSQGIELTENIDLGTIKVEKGINLEEIVVRAQVQLIERKIDRTVFNIDNTANANGGDALELMKITPGMKVQNQQLLMIGKSSVVVMLNGKIMNMPGGNIAEFLRSIPSENVKKIEVITAPPAKYETAGNSGLVNIILKKAKADSWNALIGANYRQRTFASGALVGNFNYNRNKLSLSASMYNNLGKQFNTQEDYADFPDGQWFTDSSYDYQFNRLNGRLSLDYQFTPKWSMGGQYLYNSTTQEFVEAPQTSVFDYETNEVLRSLRSDGFVEQKPTIHLINWHTVNQLDTLGRMMTINLDYFTFNNRDNKNYDGFSEQRSPSVTQFFGGQNINVQDISNISGKIDFDYPTPFVNLNFGGKVNFTKSVNDISAFNSGLVNEPVKDYPLDPTSFEYTENIQALYFSGNKKLSKEWEIQVGLRMENTQTEIVTQSQEESVDNDYYQFFPTVYLAYQPSKETTYSLSYNRRIKRPSFIELNPNLYFSNPFQSIEGNPFLQPAFIDNVELSHNYRSFQSKIYFSHEDNVFSQIAIADPSTNIINYTNENFITTQRFGFTENYYFNKFRWWNSSNSFDINYTVSTSDFDITNQREEGFNSRISTFNNFILNKKGNLIFTIAYSYSFQGVDGIYQLKANSALSGSLQYRLLENKLTLTLRGFDIFGTEVIGVSSTVNNTFQRGEYYYDNQSLMFSVNYKFGNNKIRAKRHQTGNADVRQRTGN